MQSHSMAEVEIEACKAQKRPCADVNRSDSTDHSVAFG
jgi:hypothetical protein